MYDASPFVGVFQKSIIDRFVKFWPLFSAKWLQNRPQTPKPFPGIPPRRAFCGDDTIDDIIPEYGGQKYIQ